MDIPVSTSTISPAWLTMALGDHAAGCTVTDIQLHDIGEGTGIFGEIARLELTYNRPSESAPTSVVVKLPCVEPANLAVAQALGIYEREVHFFNEVAPGTALRVPTCFHSELGDDGRFVLVLEDLGSEYDVGDQVIGATVAQAEAVIDALVDLHATWWETDALHALHWLPVPDAPAYMAAVPDIYRGGLAVLEEQWADRLPPAALDIARTLEPRFEELMHRIAQPPLTFAHSDTRLDNLFFLRAADAEGDAQQGLPAVAFIDFQLSLRQHGVADLAYLIGTSMNLDESRPHWEALLKRWHDALVARDVDYAWDDCLRHYKEAALYYLCGAMSLIGSFDTGNERGAAMAEAYVTRVFNHAVDIDAIAVL